MNLLRKLAEAAVYRRYGIDKEAAGAMDRMRALSTSMRGAAPLAQSAQAATQIARPAAMATRVGRPAAATASAAKPATFASLHQMATGPAPLPAHLQGALQQNRVRDPRLIMGEAKQQMASQLANNQRAYAGATF